MVGPIERERVEGRSGSIEGGCDGRTTVLQAGNGWNTNHTSTDKSGETHVMHELESGRHHVATCTGAMGGTKCKDGTWGNHHTPCKREEKTRGRAGRMDPSQSQDEGSSVAIWNPLPTEQEDHHAAQWFGNAGHNQIPQLAEAVASRTQSRASERPHLITA